MDTVVLIDQKYKKCIYSGTCAIRHLSFLTSCDIRQKFMVPKVVLLTKKTLSILTSCTIRHISLVPWCVGLDRFHCITTIKQVSQLWIEKSIARTSYISARWWCMFCFVGFLVLAHRSNMSSFPSDTYPDSEPTSLCFYFLMLSA